MIFSHELYQAWKNRIKPESLALRENIPRRYGNLYIFLF